MFHNMTQLYKYTQCNTTHKCSLKNSLTATADVEMKRTSNPLSQTCDVSDVSLSPSPAVCLIDSILCVDLFIFSQQEPLIRHDELKTLL